MEALHELGIQPSVCLGVSGGAWNAAAVAVGNVQRLRAYWRFFWRMPYLDLRNLLREHSPFIWSRLHERAFERYVGNERIRATTTLPLYVALTRLRDRTSMIFDVRESADPLRLLIASNYLPPFFTHAPRLEGERYGDGGFSDNLPYESLFDLGCDAVIVLASKGESEGGLFRNREDYDHVISNPFRDRVVVIRPRHRLPLGFVERRWERLAPIANLGSRRTREILLGEEDTDYVVPPGRPSPSVVFLRIRDWTRTRFDTRRATNDTPPRS